MGKWGWLSNDDTMVGARMFSDPGSCTFRIQKFIDQQQRFCARNGYDRLQEINYDYSNIEPGLHSWMVWECSAGCMSNMVMFEGCGGRDELATQPPQPAMHNLRML